MTKHSRAYAENLAKIHHEAFDFFARGVAPGTLQLLRGAGIKDGLVVDLGCGSGIWARALTDAGYDVLGYDISAPIIRIARKEAPAARFKVASFLDAELPACAAVTAQGEIFNYLFDARNGRPALRKLFRRVHKVLQPGGLFIFDVAEPGRALGRAPVWIEEADWNMAVSFDERGRTLKRSITTFVRKGKLWHRDYEEHRQTLYKGSELAADLRAAGFTARTQRRYGKYELPPHYVALVARKPA